MAEEELVVSGLDSHIYIFKVPMRITGADEFGPVLVQVGSCHGGRPGFHRRMYQHHFAWYLATSKLSLEKNVGSKAKNPETAEYVTKYKPAEFRKTFVNVIGVIERRTNAGDDDTDALEDLDDLRSKEAFVRSRIGVPVNAPLIADLLSQPFTHYHKTVLNRGGPGNFSLTELRLVSKKELESLTTFFNKFWDTKKRVKLDDFIKHKSEFVLVFQPSIAITFHAKYSSVPVSEHGAGAYHERFVEKDLVELVIPFKVPIDVLRAKPNVLLTELAEALEALKLKGVEVSEDDAS